jgi:hypothetical protein
MELLTMPDGGSTPNTTKTVAYAVFSIIMIIILYTIESLKEVGVMPMHIKIIVALFTLISTFCISFVSERGLPSLWALQESVFNLPSF